MFNIKQNSKPRGLQDILGQFNRTITDLKEFVSTKEEENLKLTEEIQKKKAQLSENQTDMGTATKVITNITELIGK